MKVYYNIRLSGIYLNASAIVVAAGPTIAARILEFELAEKGIPQNVKPEDMVEIDTSKPTVYIINDGDY